MFRSGTITTQQQTILVARVKKRVKDLLPQGQYIILVQEVPCSDTGCPIRATVISICNQAGEHNRLVIHAPLSMVTAKEVEYVMNKKHEMSIK